MSIFYTCFPTTLYNNHCFTPVSL